MKFLHPTDIKYNIGNIVFEFVNNLKLKEYPQRQRALTGLISLVQKYSPYESVNIIETLKYSLDTGYKQFIMTHAVNELIRAVDRPYLIDYSLPVLIPILLEDIFGSIAVDREAQVFAGKYPESKKSKSVDCFVLIAKKINFRASICTVVNNLREHIETKTRETEEFNKLTLIVNNLINGLKNNPSVEGNDLLLMAFPMLLEVVDRQEKQENIEAEWKNVIAKGNTTEAKATKVSYTTQLENHYNVQLAAAEGKKFSNEIVARANTVKNTIVATDIFAMFGLNLVQMSLVQEAPKNIDTLLDLVGKLLNSEHTFLVTRSLKIFTQAIDLKLLGAKKNLRRVKSVIFRYLGAANKSNVELTQTLLKCLSDLLSKYSFEDIENEKIKVVIDYLTLTLDDVETRSYTLACFLALLKKKVIHPSIYEMIELLQNSYYNIYEKHHVEIIQTIFLTFLENYPTANLLKTINFFVGNFESKSLKVVVNSLGMIERLYSNMSPEIRSKYEDFVILKICTISCTSDQTIKRKTAELLKLVFDNLPANRKSFYTDYFVDCLKGNKGEAFQKMGLAVLLMLTEDSREIINISSKNLFKASTNIIESELEETRKLLEGLSHSNLDSKKFSKRELFSKDAEDHKITQTVKVNVKQFDLLWMALSLIENLSVNYEYLLIHKFNTNLVELLVKATEHPNSINKLKSLQVLKMVIENYLRYEIDLLALLQGSGFKEFATYLTSLVVSSELSQEIADNAAFILCYLFKSNFKLRFANDDIIAELVNELYRNCKSQVRQKEFNGTVSRSLAIATELLKSIDEKHLDMTVRISMLAIKVKREATEGDLISKADEVEY